MNQTSTVTIANTFYKILAELSASSGKSIQAVLEQAIEQYRRQQFLEAANQAYIALRNNSEEIRRRQCRVPTDNNVVGKRHCRLLIIPV